MDLSVTGLAVARGGIAVLRGLSFRVAAGRVLVLRGPNGIGKTTVLRTIAGLQRPLAGTIAPGPAAVAYAGHADAVKAALSAAENLRFWADIHGCPDPAATVGAALAEVGLAGLEGRAGHSLSAGQRRRLGLARLLVVRRPVWALDEPTVSLDAAGVAVFSAMLARHLAAGGSAVASSHIDLGIGQVPELDLTPFRAAAAPPDGGADAAAGFDEAFL